MSAEINQRLDKIETDIERIVADVENNVNTLFGDRRNINGNPGVVAEQRRLADEQKRTGEILLDVRDSLRRLNWIVLTAVVTALLAQVVKGIPHS